jgi:hypothetical protein
MMAASQLLAERLAREVLMQKKRLFRLKAVLSLCFLLASIHDRAANALDTSQSVWPTKEWLTSTPEEQGMDSSALAKLVTDGENSGFDSLIAAATSSALPGRFSDASYVTGALLFVDGGMTAL